MIRTPRMVLIGGLILGAVAFWRLRTAEEAPEPEAPAVGTTPHPARITASTDERDPAAVAIPTPVAGSDPAIVALWELPVEVPLIEMAFRDGDPVWLRSFPVRLGPHRTAEVDVELFEEIGGEEGVFTGSVRGQPDSTAVFSYVGRAYAGTVVLGSEERAFYVTATEDGRMRITELDLRHAPLCGQPLLAAVDHQN